jgi:hypothetical protein
MREHYDSGLSPWGKDQAKRGREAKKSYEAQIAADKEDSRNYLQRIQDEELEAKRSQERSWGTAGMAGAGIGAGFGPQGMAVGAAIGSGLGLVRSAKSYHDENPDAGWWDAGFSALTDGTMESIDNINPAQAAGIGSSLAYQNAMKTGRETPLAIDAETPLDPGGAETFDAQLAEPFSSTGSSSAGLGLMSGEREAPAMSFGNQPMQLNMAPPAPTSGPMDVAGDTANFSAGLDMGGEKPGSFWREKTPGAPGTPWQGQGLSQSPMDRLKASANLGGDYYPPGVLPGDEERNFPKDIQRAMKALGTSLR